LPFPEAVFDLKFFRKQPEPFISLASALWPSKHTPTYTHSFLALLAKDNKKKLLRNYSQNIDGLVFLAGMPAEHLVECHGHFRSSSCIQCRKPADQKQVEVDILQHARPTSCKHCKGLVKPDIVFFGEQLPSRFHNLLSKDTEASDLCIVIGTSLMVAPVNMIPEMVDCKVALINRETVGKQVDLECLGDCDHVIRQVAMALGWDKELDEHHEKVVKNAKVKTEMKD
jgi:NAD-dependent SIR2 family protein deacetylase